MMSLKDNSVILYFDSHPDGGEFIKKPILDLYGKEIKSLLVEDARGLPHEEFENTRLGQLISERGLSSFYQSELDLYISLLERKGQILSAEFSHEPKSEDEIKFHDRNSLEIQKLMISWNNLCLVEKLSSLKEYFKTYTQYIFLNRELRMIANIDEATKPCLLRVGCAHSLMRKKVDYSTYHIKTILQPMYLTYPDCISRKNILGSDVTDEEYLKGFICLILSFNDEIMLLVNGKSTSKFLNHQDGLFGNLFFNCVADQIVYEQGKEFVYEDIIKMLYTVFDSNGRVQINALKQFFKKHSMDNYGSLVFYDRCQKQGFIKFEN